MNTRTTVVVLGFIGVLIMGAAIVMVWMPGGIPQPNGNGTGDDLIQVTSPTENQVVSSPLRIEGQARGNWYFEASFPVRLVDANGNVLAQAPAQAQGEWMTTEFVPFALDLVYTLPTTQTGTLILEKDNPSGLPQNADERRIPVRFANYATSTQTVTLYYYDPEQDKDAGGNILCSEQGLVAVERRIPTTQTPLADTIRLLLRGELTAMEELQGVETEFPLPGVLLVSASITDSTATLTFVDPQNRTVGGSCRVGILWAQIEETAKQFPTVTSVRFMPEELFQP